MRRAPAQAQALIGLAVLAAGALLAWGATGISSEAGYSGVGPNFLPWVVAGSLMVCGAWLLWQSQTGGFRQAPQPTGALQGDWRAFAWVCAGLIANALLITRVGFVVSCAVCFLLAARGLRRSEGQRAGLRVVMLDAGIGLIIAWAVYGIFTRLLSIQLPSLTATGWL